jgi:hypothetical protein
MNTILFCFFCLPTEVLGICGLLIYLWNGLENTFPTVYYMPQNFLNCNHKTTKKNMLSFSDCRSGDQKNRNGQTIAVLYYHVFY